MMWYRVTRYPQVFDTGLVSKLRYTITQGSFFVGLTVGQRDPWVLGCHSLVLKFRYTIT